MEESDEGGILIYPAYFKASIEQGNIYFITVNIKNESNSDIRISPSFGKFTQERNTNQNQFEITDEFDSWFSSEELTVEANQTEELVVQLEIPQEEKLETTSYYPAIILSQSSTESSDGTEIVTEQVIPLYIDLSEERNISASIDRYETSSVVFGNTSNFSLTITNNGNTYFSPTSYIEFHQVNLLNNEEKTRINTIPVSKADITLLPESYIKETVSWVREKFGKYEATLYVLSGSTELQSETLTFWMIPSSFIKYFIIGVGIIALLVTSLKRYKYYRKIKKSS